MNQTQSMAIELLRHSLSGETVQTLPDEEQLRRSIAFADQYDLAHAIGYALKRSGKMPGGTLGARLQKKLLEANWRTQQLLHEQRRIAEALERARIPHIFLKGAVLRTLYPEPWLRPSVDLDLLVRREDYTTAVETLCRELGYTKGEQSTHDTWVVFPSGLHAEIHMALVERHPKWERLLKGLWDTASLRPGTQYEYQMAPEMFYLYFMAHMVKHFEEGGCGIRPFMDLWLLHKEQAGVPKNTLLTEAGLDAFERAAVRLAEKWFSGGPEDALCRRMEDYLFRGGMFGTLERRVLVEQSAAGGKLGYLRSLVFPSREKMLRWYPELESHPWRMPYYQIHRWFAHDVRGKLRRAGERARLNQESSTSDAQAVSRLLEELELL